MEHRNRLLMNEFWLQVFFVIRFLPGISQFASAGLRPRAGSVGVPLSAPARR